MEVQELQPGQRVNARHVRKGNITGTVVDNTDSEWITITLEEEVRGLASTWVEGEDLTCRKSFLQNINLI